MPKSEQVLKRLLGATKRDPCCHPHEFRRRYQERLLQDLFER